MRYSALFPSVLFLLMAPCSSEAQCTGAIPLAPEEVWLIPELPPTPTWGSNVPPLSAGDPFPPPCNTPNYGVNCHLCPATWRAELSTDTRILVHLCVGQAYLFSTCGSAEEWDSQITITNAAGNFVYAYDDDACGAMDGHSSILFSPPSTSAYGIRVSNPGCAAMPVRTALLTMECMAGPCADDGDNPCSSAGTATCNPNIPACPDTEGFIELVNSGTTCDPVEATTFGYTGTSGINPPTCGTYPNTGDIWFGTTVPPSGSVVIEVEQLSAINLAMAWYTAASCQGPFIPGGCNSNISNLYAQPRITLNRPDLSGETIYIRVWPEANQANGGTFLICAREGMPPENDVPCSAAALLVGSTCTPTVFSLADASQSDGVSFSPTNPTCGTPIVMGDAWFVVAVPPDQLFSVQLSGEATSRPALAAYTLAFAPCATGPYMQLACANAPADESTVSLDLFGTPGELVYLRVWDRSVPEGEMQICVINTPPPVNDEPCGALPLDVQYGCLPVYVDMSGATPSANVPIPSCSNALSDVWYTFEVPENGEVTLNTDDLGITDAALAVYRSVSGSCTANDLVLEELVGSCTTDGSANTGALNMPRVELEGLVPGETLWVRVLNETESVNGLALCAGRTDALPFNPGLECALTLTMNDAAGDGWNGSTVTVFISGQSDIFTLVGGTGSIALPASQSATYVISYQGSGFGQNQISYTVTNSYGGLVYSSLTPPTNGIVSAGIVDCNLPPPSDNCSSASNWTTANPVVLDFVSIQPNLPDLDPDNQGCLENGEQNGHWYRVSITHEGPFGMQITPSDPTVDIDFALWEFTEFVCPPTTQPIRCSFAGLSGPTGMDYTATDLSEGPAGDSWVRYLDTEPGQQYLLYVSSSSTEVESYSIELLFPTALAETLSSDKNALLVFPNPSDGNSLSITTAAPAHGTPTLRIFDSAGRVVRGERLLASVGTASVQISIEELAAGTYMIELIEDSGSSLGRSRFVKLNP